MPEPTSQAFAVLLPVRSVGAMGDGRTYDFVVTLSAVQTSDVMTADRAELPYALLNKASGRILNEVRGINRVAYDVSGEPPATIEWVSDGSASEPSRLIRQNIPLAIRPHRQRASRASPCSRCRHVATRGIGEASSICPIGLSIC